MDEGHLEVVRETRGASGPGAEHRIPYTLLRCNGVGAVARSFGLFSFCLERKRPLLVKTRHAQQCARPYIGYRECKLRFERGSDYSSKWMM